LDKQPAGTHKDALYALYAGQGEEGERRRESIGKRMARRYVSSGAAEAAPASLSLSLSLPLSPSPSLSLSLFLRLASGSVSRFPIEESARWKK
jgi:hypothetical protein